MVNVIAPIFTSKEGVFLQTIYHSLRLAAEKSGPVALDAFVECGSYRADYAEVAAVPYLDALATLDEGQRKLYLSLVNLSKDEPTEVEVHVEEADVRAGGAAHVVTGEAPEVVNDFGVERVGSRTESLEVPGRRFSYTLPAAAHAVLELEIA